MTTASSTQRQWALITGASSGIGAAVAEKLAAAGYDLVLVARRLPKLEELKASLNEAHGTSAHCLSIDLGEENAVALLLEEIGRLGIRINLLVNNAGYGSHGDFVATDLKPQVAMIDLNCRRLVELSHGFATQMKRGDTIVHTASVGGFVPAPYFAVYGATKAFVVSFSEAISRELGPRGVRVITLCPGPVDTEFSQVAQFNGTRPPKASIQTPEQVAQELMDMLAGKGSLLITGRANRLTVGLLRLLPRRAAISFAERSMRPSVN